MQVTWLGSWDPMHRGSGHHALRFSQMVFGVRSSNAFVFTFSAPRLRQLLAQPEDDAFKTAAGVTPVVLQRVSTGIELTTRQGEAAGEAPVAPTDGPRIRRLATAKLRSRFERASSVAVPQPSPFDM